MHLFKVDPGVSMANYDISFQCVCRMHLRPGSMGIKGEEGLVSGTKWLCQTAVNTWSLREAQQKGVCGTVALGRQSTFRCQPAELMHKCSH